MRPRHAMLVAVALLGLACQPSCWAAKRKTQRPRRQVLPLEGPCDEHVWDSGLMEKTLSYATLLEKGQQYHESAVAPDAKRTRGKVLGYVTPWNRDGYHVAMRFRHKLTHVAPVWYQLRLRSGGGGGSDKYVLEGGHEYNATWAAELKEGGSGPALVPRVIVELQGEAMVDWVRDPQPGLALVVAEAQARQYDGIVLEVWSAWEGMHGLANDDFREAAYKLVAQLSQQLSARDMELILAIPPLFPAHHKAPFTDRTAILSLAPFVAAWSVMTYDYSSSQGTPGPNAPLPWFEDNLEYAAAGNLASRGSRPEGEAQPPLPAEAMASLLMGLNFYGWDFEPARGGIQAVTGPAVLKLLAQHTPEVQWSDHDSEHYFTYTDGRSQHKVYYPTPRALQQRIEAAERAGAGLSIWELGQGLARFMELL